VRVQLLPVGAGDRDQRQVAVLREPGLQLRLPLVDLGLRLLQPDRRPESVPLP